MFIYLFNYLFIYLFIYSFIYLFIYLLPVNDLFITCCMYLQGHELQGVVRGANGPLIQKSIKELLEQDHKIQDGHMERPEVRLIIFT